MRMLGCIGEHFLLVWTATLTSGFDPWLGSTELDPDPEVDAWWAGLLVAEPTGSRYPSAGMLGQSARAADCNRIFFI